MLVMLQVTDPVERNHTMTKREGKGEVVALKDLLRRDEDFVRSAVQALVQEALEAEMTEAIGAAKGVRSAGRDAGAAGAAGSGRSVFDGAVRALPAVGKGLGGGAGGDVRAGGVDTEGE